MTEAVLLLGHGKTTGLRLARVLKELGFAPKVATWSGFSPRMPRRDRPRIVLADMDQPNAAPMADLSRDIRKHWGESAWVVAVSASSRFGDVSSLIDAGADDFLPVAAAPELVERKMRRGLDVRRAAENVGPDEEIPEGLARLFYDRTEPLRLGDVAAVHVGAAPRRSAFRRMAPPDGEWRGVLTSAVVDRFYAGKPDSYLRWSRLHLFRMPSPDEYAVAEKVLLRRSGPPLAAAVDRSRLPAGADVYALVPRDGVSAGWLACILNSRLMDFYFNRLAGVGRDGRLRVEDVRDAPVPRPDAEAMQELSRTASLLAHYGPNPQTWIDRQSKDDLWSRMDETVFRLYGAGSGEREELAALHF